MPSGVYPRTEYHKNRIRLSGERGRFKSGAAHPSWQGGIRKYHTPAEYLKLWRHKKGISNRFNDGIHLTSEVDKKEYIRLYKEKHRERIRYLRKKYKYSKQCAGILTKQTIQSVYEDNIKLYGTLTCYLCLNPVPFGKDHLEHKTPLSRGGTNARDNLDIACQKCNCCKHNKTETEYREGLCVLGRN